MNLFVKVRAWPIPLRHVGIPDSFRGSGPPRALSYNAFYPNRSTAPNFCLTERSDQSVAVSIGREETLRDDYADLKRDGRGTLLVYPEKVREWHFDEVVGTLPSHMIRGT
jgi:hypothetical protein